jgi:hypothetical protein
MIGLGPQFIEVQAVPGGEVVRYPHRSALRVDGSAVAVAPVGSAQVDLTLTLGHGPTGATGAVGDKGVTGAGGAAGATGATGAAQAMLVHDTTYSPVGLWQFNGSLADTSGNAYDFSVDTGTPLYGQLAPNVPGVFLSACRLKAAVAANLLRILGNATIEFLLLPLADNTGAMPTSAPLVSFTGGQDDISSASNYLYQVAFDPGRLLYWFSEHGTGVNDTYQITAQALPPLRQLMHIAATRTADVIQFYVNGRAFGAPSSALTTPTGGSTAQLWVGGQGGTAPTLAPDCGLASLKIIASALTAAQVKAEFNRTAGKFYGYIP